MESKNMKKNVKHMDLISVYGIVKKEIKNVRWEGISEHYITDSYYFKTGLENI